MAEEQRLRANKRIAGEVCGWCGHAIEFGQDVVICGDCEAAHHTSHWDTKAGCAVEGCLSAPLEQMAPPPPPVGGRGATPRGRPRRGGQRSGKAEGATSSLVFGLLGLLICGVIFGVVAIVNANKAKAAIRRNPRLTGEGMATAGMILGIIDIVAWGLIILANLASR